MFTHYVKAAIRNFRRNGLFSAIHVLGLSIGISAAMVIFLIVHFEFGFDRFEPDAGSVYRVVLDARINGSEGHSAGVPAPLAAAIQTEVTGVKSTVPVMQFQGDATATVSVGGGTSGGETFKRQSGIVFTNSQYFDLLPFHWLAGSPRTSLADPFTVVLTETRAKQYFPGLSPASIVGRQLTYNNIPVTVSGVVRDMQSQTSFKAVEFISYPTIDKTGLRSRFMMDVWNDWMIYSTLYVKIENGYSPVGIEAQLKTILEKYDPDANKDADHRLAFHLQPLNDIHFDGRYRTPGSRIAEKPVLYGLSAIAAFLLLLGCINFINLSTAQAFRRAREIGIRKTMGGSRGHLMIQFLTEACLITLVAAGISLLLTPLLLRIFADLIPPGMSIKLMYQPAMILFSVMLVLAVSLLAGLYPAFILSGFRPVRVLQSRVFSRSANGDRAGLRKVLTVMQFMIAQFFVIATVVVSKQINFSLHADMGFNKDAIINFDLPRDTVTSHEKAFLRDIRSLPGVAVASTGFFAPADEGVAFTNISFNNGKTVLTPNTQIRWGDPDYIRVYQIKLIAGRDVEPSDTIREFLVNQAYAHAIGFSDAAGALGKSLTWNGKQIPIVGIMRDFHDQSMRAPISPVVFGGAMGSTLHIKLRPNNAGGTLWKNTLAAMRRDYHMFYPEGTFTYRFLDDTIANFYESEQRTARLLAWATALAILISSLGLLGLVIYTTSLRTKEIGIRKVLGASVIQIVSMLSADFMRWVLVAFMIAAPLAWWATHRWLEGFAYRTALNWWIFLLSGLVMIFFAFATLSLQTIRAARANPVNSLATE